jgi:hypothetical protein
MGLLFKLLLPVNTTRLGAKEEMAVKNLRVAPEPPQFMTSLGFLSEPTLFSTSSPHLFLIVAPKDLQALRLATASVHMLGFLSLDSPLASNAQAKYL